MKKRIVILTLIVVLLIIGLFKLNKDFLLLWNANNITLSVEAPLSKENVKIECGLSTNAIRRNNSQEMFDGSDKYTVLYDGELKKQMSNEYGENDFLITYDDKYYCIFRQFKLNRRHQHDYNFHLYKKEQKIYLKVEIVGKDAMMFERPMIEINEK